MRITNNYSQPTADQTQASQRKQVDAGATQSGDPASGSEGAVKVSVSAKARELAEAHAHANGGIDEAKVSRLQDALKSGTLTMDKEKIATKIVDGD